MLFTKLIFYSFILIKSIHYTHVFLCTDLFMRYFNWLQALLLTDYPSFSKFLILDGLKKVWTIEHEVNYRQTSDIELLQSFFYATLIKIIFFLILFSFIIPLQSNLIFFKIMWKFEQRIHNTKFGWNYVRYHGLDKKNKQTPIHPPLAFVFA